MEAKRTERISATITAIQTLIRYQNEQRHLRYRKKLAYGGHVSAIIGLVVVWTSDLPVDSDENYNAHRRPYHQIHSPTVCAHVQHDHAQTVRGVCTSPDGAREPGNTGHF
ncbi:unnamed protein product [Sphagnum balticum]